MTKERVLEFSTGLFMLAALGALLVLAFKVSGLTIGTSSKTYQLTADFENIGDLKARAPVTIAGVRIGQVAKIDLNPQTYKAVVTLSIETHEQSIPVDSSASIVTAGLLGANYISIAPGFEITSLKNGEKIQETHPAIQLETMIGQLMFNMNKDKKS